MSHLAHFLTIVTFFFGFFIESMGQTNSVIDSLNRSMTLTEDPERKMDILYEIAEAWAELNFDSSHHYAKQLNYLANENSNATYQINGCRAIGLAFDYAYEMDSASFYYHKALEIAQGVKDTSSIALLKFNLGTVELLSGKYISVLPWFKQAIELLELTQDDDGLLLNIYNNLGIVYRRIDRIQDAKNIFLRALSILDSAIDQHIRIDIFTNLGNVMISLENYDSAEYYYRAVKEYAEKENNQLDFAFATNGLGMVEESRGHYIKSIEYFDEVIKMKGIEEDYVLFTAQRFKAEILSELGAYDSAQFYFDRASKIFEEEDYPDEIKELYLQLATHHERLGQISIALEFLKKHYKLKEQLVSEEVINRTSEWEQRYQAQEKEKEIINLKLMNEEASLLAQQQKNERNILIFLSLGLIVIAVFIYYMYQLKQKVNKGLEEKNELIKKALADKELLMKEIHHRVKNNLQVISSLLNLQSNFITDSKATAAMMESKNRVHSMALIHQRLYQNENLTEIDLEEYLDQLLDNLEHSYSSGEKEIDIGLEATKMMMDVDKVILLGLIVNELVTNSFKYAFENVDTGIINVNLKEIGEFVELTVCDNGKGMESPPEIKQGSLGTLLVNDLSKKLNAKLAYDLSKGTSVSIRFIHKKQVAA